MMDNTRIKCYGTLRKRQCEIYEDFDWSRILQSTSEFERIEDAPDMFYVIMEENCSVNIIASGRQIIIHSGHAYRSKILAFLEAAVSNAFDCRCTVSTDRSYSHYTVSLYIPDTRTHYGITCGDKLSYGSFSLSSGRDKEPIIWRVLDIYEDTALLISDQCLMQSGYCDKDKVNGESWYLMWGNSLARERCNGFFYYNAFSDDEKKYIIPQQIEEVEYGPVCTDSVFLLSESQARLFFLGTVERKAAASQELERLEASSPDHRLHHGTDVDRKFVSWWLLPEENDNNSIYPKAVWPNGAIQYHGRNVYHSDFTIRPCICVRISKGFPFKDRKEIQEQLLEKDTISIERDIYPFNHASDSDNHYDDLSTRPVYASPMMMGYASEKVFPEINKKDGAKQSIRYCYYCGNNIMDSSDFCPECGRKIHVDLDPDDTVNLCVHCGNAVPSISYYCPYCGKDIRPNKESQHNHKAKISIGPVYAAPPFESNKAKYKSKKGILSKIFKR